MGLFLLDWADVIASDDPHGPLTFALSPSGTPATVCGWDPELASSAEGTPPPVS